MYMTEAGLRVVMHSVPSRYHLTYVVQEFSS